MPAILNEQTQFVDSAGKPLVFGKAYFGDQNADPVLNPVSIFSDRELTVALTNPQLLDSLGRTANKVWLAGRYSIRVDDLSGAQIYQELDNGESPAVGVTALENVVGADTITATATSTITAYEDLELYAFRTAQVNTTAVTLNIDGVGAKSVVKNHDQAVLPAEFEADQNIVVSFNETDDVFEWINQNNKVIDFYEGTPVASAATTNIWVSNGNTVHITGTTTITSFGTAPNIGAWKRVIFDGILTLTDGANLNLPGGANITTAAGDFAFVYADTTTLFQVLYFKADGTAVVAPPVNISLGTAVATTSGTEHDFTIDSDTIAFDVELEQVSLTSSALRFVLGDAGGPETAGYSMDSSRIGATVATAGSTASFLVNDTTATRQYSGVLHFRLIDPATFTWAMEGGLSTGASGGFMYEMAGEKSLSAALTTFRITGDGVGTFDLGKVNVTEFKA